MSISFFIENRNDLAKTCFQLLMSTFNVSIFAVLFFTLLIPYSFLHQNEWTKLWLQLSLITNGWNTFLSELNQLKPALPTSCFIWCSIAIISNHFNVINFSNLDATLNCANLTLCAMRRWCRRHNAGFWNFCLCHVTFNWCKFARLCLSSNRGNLGRKVVSFRFMC